MDGPAHETLPDGTYAEVVVPSTSSLVEASGDRTGPARALLPNGSWAPVVVIDGGSEGSGLDASTLDGQDGTYYLARANHTGLQAIATITGLQAALDAKEATANKGVANGYAPLGADTKVAAQYLPTSSDKIGLGFWNATTNTPTLADGPGAAADNNYYIVEVAGTQDLGSGSIVFNEGDEVVFHTSDNKWHRIGRSDAVASVNGKVGAVVLNAADVGALATLPSVAKTVAGYNESGQYTNVAYDEAPGAFALVMRGFDEFFTVKDATDDQHPVSKKQLDTEIGAIPTAFTGNFGAPVAHSTSGDINLTVSDKMVHLVTCTGDVSVNLPVSGVTPGKVFTIKRMDNTAHGLNIFTDSGLIENTGDIGMSAQFSFRTVTFDGTNWWVIGSNGA